MEYELHELTNSTNVIEVRSQKLEARSQKKSCLLPLITSCFLLLTSCFLFVESVNAKECKIIEPEVLKRSIENKTYNTVIFDVSPRFDNINMKRKFDLSTNRNRIPRTIWTSIKDIEKELVGRVDELIGKDVFFVGEDTASAESACRYMMKKDYGIRNFYVLKGGLEKWDGPLAGDILKVECKMINSPELINIIKSNKEVKIIDQRSADEYHEGHIPGARLEGREGSNKMRPSLKSRLQKAERFKKWEQENTTVVYVYQNEFQALRDCRYVKYFSWGYENIYVLRGGMKVWEGEIEKDYLEILKKKVKERLK